VIIYAKTLFALEYGHVKTVFTIHNIEYQGRFTDAVLGDVFSLGEKERGIVTYDKQINLMKGAIVTCDKLTTVSPTYAGEIMDIGGYGLEKIIAENSYKLLGIINGIDMDVNNPETNPHLQANYSADSPQNKSANKKKIQAIFGMEEDPRKMMIAVVSRLVPHKGVDLITYILEDICRMDVQFILLGTGYHSYELFFSEAAMRHPGKIGVNIAYNAELSDLIYSAADAILMPSASEPCGLSQMIACRYGAIPIARRTGGLNDTIKDCRLGHGNGFLFDEYSGHALLDTIRQAADLYSGHEEDWNNLVREAMRTDFSWNISALEYLRVYFDS